MVLVDIRCQTPGRGSCPALSKITGTLDQQGQVAVCRRSSAARIPIESSPTPFLAPPAAEGRGEAARGVLIEGGSGMTGHRSVLRSGKFTLEDRVTVDAGGTEAERGLARTAAQTFRAGKPDSAQF